MRTFLKYHLPAILYAVLILSVSSIPWLKVPQIRHFATDKVAHFIEYGIFAFLIFRSLAHLPLLARNNLTLPAAVLFVAAFAYLDEIYQLHIPGRHSDMADYAADLAGALLILGLTWLRHRNRRPQSPDERPESA
jgi:VanZ family protein